MAKKYINLESIKRALSSHLKEFEKEYGVREFAVFGSYAKGKERNGSDVDVLVEFAEAPDLFRFIELERKLEELLEVKVDLVRKKALRPELKVKILREAISI
jgi:predicted nucleotidyltransferase